MQTQHTHHIIEHHMKIKVPNKSPQRIDENAVAVKRACIWHADIHANGDHSLNRNARIHMCVCIETTYSKWNENSCGCGRVCCWFICLIPLRIHDGNSIAHDEVREWKREMWIRRNIWKLIGTQLSWTLSPRFNWAACVCLCVSDFFRKYGVIKMDWYRPAELFHVHLHSHAHVCYENRCEIDRILCECVWIVPGCDRNSIWIDFKTENFVWFFWFILSLSKYTIPTQLSSNLNFILSIPFRFYALNNLPWKV